MANATTIRPGLDRCQRRTAGRKLLRATCGSWPVTAFWKTIAPTCRTAGYADAYPQWDGSRHADVRALLLSRITKSSNKLFPVTSNTLPVAASFLNLDLELEAFTDLTPIAEYFGSGVYVLYSGEVEGGFRLSIEPVIDGLLSGDPIACTEYFLHLIEGLSSEHNALWRSCKSKTFDYGFYGGLEENPLHTNISPDHLARMANLGLELRITIYPFRAAEPEVESDVNADNEL